MAALCLSGCQTKIGPPTESDFRSALASMHAPESEITDFRQLNPPTDKEPTFTEGAIYEASFEAHLTTRGLLRIGPQTVPTRRGASFPVVGTLRLRVEGSAWVASDTTMELLFERREPDDSAAQQHTLQEMRKIGRALEAWLTDNLQSAGGDSADIIDMGMIQQLSPQEVEALVVSRYLDILPRLDGWGHEYQFFVNKRDLLRGSGLMAIRSPGRDGKFPRTFYRDSYTGRTAYDEDIVWLDGQFFQRPQL